MTQNIFAKGISSQNLWDPVALSQQKAHLRQEVLARRKDLSQTHQEKAAQQLACYAANIFQLIAYVQVFFDQNATLPSAHLFSEEKKKIIIGTFYPLSHEINPHYLMEKFEETCAFALPRLHQKELVFHLWRKEEELEKSYFDLLVPLQTAPIILPSILFVPLIAFDPEGNRIGYGKGYYDRFLLQHRLAASSGLSLPLTIGLAFSVQEVPSIPFEPHDVPLDCVLTEKGLHIFSPLLKEAFRSTAPEKD